MPGFKLFKLWHKEVWHKPLMDPMRSERLPPQGVHDVLRNCPCLDQGQKTWILFGQHHLLGQPIRTCPGNTRHGWNDRGFGQTKLLHCLEYSTSFNHALRRVLDQGTKTWTLSTTHQIVWNSMFDTEDSLGHPLFGWSNRLKFDVRHSSSWDHTMIRRPGFGDWMATNHGCYPITAAWASISSKNQSSTAPRDASWATGPRCSTLCQEWLERTMFSNSGISHSTSRCSLGHRHKMHLEVHV